MHKSSVNRKMDKVETNVITLLLSPLKFPMKAMPTESKLCAFAWAPTTPHPRPSYTAPSPDIRKLNTDRLHVSVHSFVINNCNIKFSIKLLLNCLHTLF